MNQERDYMFVTKKKATKDAANRYTAGWSRGYAAAEEGDRILLAKLAQCILIAPVGLADEYDELFDDIFVAIMSPSKARKANLSLLLDKYREPSEAF